MKIPEVSRLISVGSPEDLLLHELFDLIPTYYDLCTIQTFRSKLDDSYMDTIVNKPCYSVSDVTQLVLDKQMTDVKGFEEKGRCCVGRVGTEWYGLALRAGYRSFKAGDTIDGKDFPFYLPTSYEATTTLLKGFYSELLLPPSLADFPPDLIGGPSIECRDWILKLAGRDFEKMLEEVLKVDSNFPRGDWTVGVEKSAEEAAILWVRIAEAFLNPKFFWTLNGRYDFFGDSL